jgi:hypothetical protein
MDLNMKKAFAVMALLAAPLATQAAPVSFTGQVYTDEASFTSALTDVAVDDFSDLDLDDVDTPVNRTITSAGGTEYSYEVDTSSNVWVSPGDSSNLWVAVDNPFDGLDFGTFTPGITAIGGYFFNTNSLGGITLGDLEIELADSLGNVFSFLVANATPTTFRGFTLDTGFVDALTVTAVNTGSSYRLANFATASSLIFGTSEQGAPAPAPAPFGVGLLGLALLGVGIARRGNVAA